MTNRRDFLKLAALSSLAGAAGTDSFAVSPRPSQSSGDEDRTYWVSVARRLATPLLEAAAKRRLKSDMPIEAHARASNREHVTYLEGLARLLCGLAPWLELPADNTAEGIERAHLAALARASIDSITDPASPDFLNFTTHNQPLVDAAFLAQALLRSPHELWEKLPASAKKNVVAALITSRPIQAGESNWKLFATTVEIFLHRIGEARDTARLLEGIDKHRAWYLGDGIYGDGPEFHWDYYNSFVIQPMLVEALDVVGEETPTLTQQREASRKHLTRWAAVQERLIAPDGTFPPLGRSLAYRCGAFQGLALAALRHALPSGVSPAQARVALTSVIRRTLEAPGTWDDRGWLQIGLAGHQPSLGEVYISTGSLYLCSIALLPLGLPSSDPFWTAPAERTTWEKTWAGENLAADKALPKTK